MHALRVAVVIIIVSAIVAAVAVVVLDRGTRSRLARALQAGPARVEAQAR